MFRRKFKVYLRNGAVITVRAKSVKVSQDANTRFTGYAFKNADAVYLDVNEIIGVVEA